MRYADVRISLPGWVQEQMPAAGSVFSSVEERMRLIIELARKNIEYSTGGPFGAGVFESNSGKLLSLGVNVVVSSNCSVAHAEIVAVSIAQQMVGDYDLSNQESSTYELVTSTEPCAMCLGCIPWSGVRSVVCGSRDEDARAIGFEEGAKPADWVRSLESSGISVIRDVLRDEAREVLRQYSESGGLIYNARHVDQRKEGR